MPRPFFFWFVFAATFASSLGAAIIRVSPKVIAFYNANFTPVDFEQIITLDPRVGAILRPSMQKYVMQIDVLMTIEDLQADQIGFGNAAFDFRFRQQLSRNNDIAGWQPDYSVFDPPPGPTGIFIPKWADNGDYGRSGTDLQSIVIGTSPASFSTGTGPNNDPRRTLGIAPYKNGDFSYHQDGEYAGTLYVEINSNRGASGILELLATGGSVYDDDANLHCRGVTAVGDSVKFHVIPEPSTLALLFSGAALLAHARMRR
jgi:hypothetical protein